MSARYKLWVGLASLALLVIFLLDNSIDGPVAWIWLVPIVIGYTLFCFGASVAAISNPWRLFFVIASGLLMSLVVLIFNDTLTIYLCGVILLSFHLAAVYSRKGGLLTSNRFELIVILLVATSLLLLPVAINRVVVKLPNLSAGTYLTLYNDGDKSAGPGRQFFNRIDNHHELNVSLGSQLYFQQPHEPPRLRIDILRDKIVVRILSIRYDTRLAFLHLPLFNISGNSLESLKPVGVDATYRLQMEQNNLLIDHLDTVSPAWVQLPHMDHHTVSIRDHVKVMLARLLVWLIVCFGLIKLAPTANLRHG